MEKNGWAGVPAPQGGNPSSQFVSLYVCLFFTSNSFIGSPSPPHCSTFCLFFVVFLHPFLSLGVGRCTGTRRQSIHQPTLFQTRPATVWETRSSTFFLLHALKAPSSDRRRPGLPRWATLGSGIDESQKSKFESRKRNLKFWSRISRVEREIWNSGLEFRE